MEILTNSLHPNNVTLTEQEETPAQQGVISFASSTRAVTGNAMNSMLNVIRASFAQTSGAAVTIVSKVTDNEPEADLNEDSPLKRSTEVEESREEKEIKEIFEQLMTI